MFSICQEKVCNKYSLDLQLSRKIDMCRKDIMFVAIFTENKRHSAETKKYLQQIDLLLLERKLLLQ